MRIFLTGGEKIGWALDTDERLAREALGRFATISKFSLYSNYIHSVSPLVTYKKYKRKPERFVAVFPGEPDRLFRADSEFADFCFHCHCIAQSQQAYEQLKKCNYPCVEYIPYIADLVNFKMLYNKDEIKDKYGIPRNKFIISSFMRDSLGKNLQEPKLEKGADVFLEIVKGICDIIGKDKIIIVLAGPRRHWIRNQLANEKISCEYIGKIVEEDDININIASPQVINELLNITDLQIISSRSEGGPRGILEAGVLNVPIISTKVGIAPDVLSPETLYTSVNEAVEMAIKQYKNQWISKVNVKVADYIRDIHSVENISNMWEKYYERLRNINK